MKFNSCNNSKPKIDVSVVIATNISSKPIIKSLTSMLSPF